MGKKRVNYIAQMTRSNKVVYQNQLHEIYADCLLPKFEVPHLSTEFNPNSAILQKSSNGFPTNSLLGVDLELADMSTYWQKTDSDEVFEEDFLYISDLVKRQSAIVMQATPITNKPDKNDTLSPTKENRRSAPQYKKSPFYSSIEDPEIQEQLEIAFNGEVPPGTVHMIKKEEPLHSFLIRSTAKTFRPNDLLMYSANKEKRFLKCIDSQQIESGNEIVANSSYQFLNETPHPRCYCFTDEEGNYHIGQIINDGLKLIPRIDSKKDPLTATPIIFKKEEGEGKGEVQETS
ncbi:hypothetical protein GPJ56_003352 [Histomonas meleagridis]|uniref:uncharacterized protein n=1 Tax=Histomonas meleagridis TaxID=135588 RepID=UPI003559C814|nr:hypothetical protein GPJ56_003352 [Histomonas meleagridis]KAH0804971.1 hypothetical protein GO595_001916 [Histomonas meleagridis]